MSEIRYDVLKCPRQIGSCELLKSFSTREEASDYIKEIGGDIDESYVLGIYELDVSSK